ncbi:hypothetical protein OTK49_21250 [Vibrio coralliirubri]|uniref:hypothetical protein n=1 Tax=Vibrio coralliirubri TaxID=1516159 RepID=UPI0022838B00|nr:hypothetical protein [Vibrio coralliirubri]MCY9865048.1 hypothetical protein [Vibrio coralliirubri]
MTNYLPYDLFRQAMACIDWRDTLESENGEQSNYRPSRFKGTLEDMIDLFIAYPYVKNETYFVASTPKEKGNTTQGFVQFYGDSKPSFCAMCYFPKMEDIHTVLPIGAFERLPEHLWQERDAMPYSRFDRRDEVSIMDGEYVVFMDSNGSIKECKFEVNPTFGNCIRPNAQKVMTTKNLRVWLETKEGKQFQSSECLGVLSEKAPKFYEAYTKKLSGEQIIQSLIG